MFLMAGILRKFVKMVKFTVDCLEKSIIILCM